eukprot:COSAG04_NODE_7413_length_1132_cov_3.195547_1_plen_111_part_10
MAFFVRDAPLPTGLFLSFADARVLTLAERSLLEIRELCTGVAHGGDRVTLQALEPNVTYSLDAFVTAQEEQAESVVVELRQFNRLTLNSVQQACSDTIDVMEEKLVSSGGF